MLGDEFRERLRAAVDRAASRKDIYGDGVSEGGLSKILSGDVANPRIFTVKAIADKIGVTVGELLGEKGHELTSADLEFIAQIVAWAQAKLPAPAKEEESRVTPRPGEDIVGDLSAPEERKLLGPRGSKTATPVTTRKQPLEEGRT